MIICSLVIRRYFELKQEIHISSSARQNLEQVVKDKNIVEKNLKLKDFYSQEILALVKKLEYTSSNSDILKAIRKSISKVLGYRTVWFYEISEDKKFADLLFDGIVPKSIKKREFTRVEIDSSPYYKKLSSIRIVDIVDDAQENIFLKLNLRKF